MALSGPSQVGDRTQLIDSENRHSTVILGEGGKFFIHRDTIFHDDLIGAREGTTATFSEGTVYLAMCHLPADYVLSIPCGTAVIYPKDTAQIIVEGDIFLGARVLEAGAGSGALNLNLLRVIGTDGQLISHEAREDHIEHAKCNVIDFMGHKPDNWDLRLGDLNEASVESLGGPIDRVILDMLTPRECLDAVSKVPQPGGVLMVYVVTVPRLMEAMEDIRVQKYFTEPRAWESLVRDWNVQDPSVRPVHRMQAHTAFLVWARRLVDSMVPPCPQRRSQKKL